MSLKVRPFNTMLDDVLAEGIIEGNSFVCRFYGNSFVVGTTKIGEDKRGSYALIEEVERPECFGYTFKVEPDYDEDFPPGCRISLFRDKTDSVRAQVREHDIDPDSVNLVGTVTESIAVYFDFDGKENGSSRSEQVPSIMDAYAM